MIIEGLAIAIIFFILGYITKIIDDIFDEKKEKPSYVLQAIFLLFIALSSLLGYYYFPSPYLGVVIGIFLSGKTDNFLFMLALLFFIPYFFLNIDYRVVVIFALSSFLDEKPAFSQTRPLLKALSLAYGIIYNIFVLAGFGAFDIGYELSNELKHKKEKKKK